MHDNTENFTRYGLTNLTDEQFDAYVRLKEGRPAQGFRFTKVDLLYVGIILFTFCSVASALVVKNLLNRERRFPVLRTSITEISSGLTLVGLVVLAVVRLLSNKYRRDAKIVKAAKTAHQARTAEVIEEGFELKTDDLAKAQRFELAKQRANARLARTNRFFAVAMIATCLVGFIAVMSIIFTFIDNNELKRRNKELVANNTTISKQLSEAMAALRVARARVGDGVPRGIDKETLVDIHKELDDAIKLVEKLSTIRPLSPLEQQELDQAKNVRDSVAEELQVDGLAMLMAEADAHYKKGEFRQAIDRYTDVIRRDPKGPHAAGAYEMRGRSHHRLRDTDEAIADLTESLRIESKNVSALCARGRIFFFKKRYEEAIADYTQALLLDEKSLEAYQGRGEAYFEMQDFDRAIADYTSAIAIDAGSAWSYTHRGWNYARRGWRKEGARDIAGANADFGRALADFTRAIEIDPNLALVYKYRAEVYRSLADGTGQGRYHEAVITDTSRAIELYEQREPEPKKELFELYSLRAYAYEKLENAPQASADRQQAKKYSRQMLRGRGLRRDQASGPTRGGSRPDRAGR